MRRRRFDEKTIQELVRLGSAGSDLSPVPRKTEERVLSVIRRNTAARRRVSLFRAFRYSPALAAAAVLLVAAPLAAVLIGTLVSPAAGRVPLVAVSDKGGGVTGRGAPLRFGDAVRERDIVGTGAGEQTGLERKGIIAVQLFSGSSLEIAKFNETRRDLALRLARGSLYVNKLTTGEEAGRVAVSIGAYDFVLRGTRVYFSFDERRVVRIICFDGLIEVRAGGTAPDGILFTVAAGEKAELKPRGEREIVRNLTGDEESLDAALRNGLPRFDFVKELPVSAEGSAAQPGDANGSDIAFPPYAVTAIGSIADDAANGEGIRFYGAAEAGGRVFLINQRDVFTIESGRVVKRPGLVDRTPFMTRPFAAGKYVGFAKPGAVILVDAASLARAAVVPLPRDGSIEHNFLPAFAAGKLCLPVQNNGYYELDPETRPANLRLLFKEPFPLGPAAAGASLCIGSYYDTYIARLTADGATAYKTRLKGNSSVNPVASGRSVYAAVVEPSGPFLIRLDEEGGESGRWRLAAPLKADFLVGGDRVIGVYGDGRLFTLETGSGRIAVIGTLFGKAMTSRQWRNTGLCPAEKGAVLYAPTDRGAILAVDPENGRAEEIAVKTGEAFYTAPFVHGNALYAVADSGAVYRIVKTSP